MPGHCELQDSAQGSRVVGIGTGERRQGQCWASSQPLSPSPLSVATPRDPKGLH